MSTIRFSGPDPKAFYQATRRELVAIINEEATLLESELVQATPGDRGGLRQGWNFKPATEQQLSAVIGQSKSYFLAVELGRKPGSGISAKGQREVAKWAFRKGIVGDPKEAKSFAYLLSRKYMREGRPAQGFAGLANKGDKAPRSLTDNLVPVGGPILAGFNRLNARLQ